MKCDELQQVENPIEWGWYYDKNEVDAAINELKEELYNQKWRGDEWARNANDKDKQIAELKTKLEDVQATAYTESVDVGMENRRLKRALWLARAWGANQRTKYLDLFLTGRAHAIRKYKWIKITSKCRAKAEEYK